MIQYDNDEVGETIRYACGGQFLTKRGLLGSPSFPDLYPKNESCEYTISVPPKNFIKVEFSVLDIRCDDKVGSDYIEIRDGMLDNSPLMIKDCSDGNRIPKKMQSTQNFLLIK